MKLFIHLTIVILAATNVSFSIEISSSVGTSIQDIKMGESRYTIFRIVNGTLLDVEFTGLRTATYDDFIQDLRKSNPTECRYGIIDYEYIENEMSTKKLVVILWDPETALMEQRLAYASVYDKEQANKIGIDRYFVVKTDDELKEEILLERLKEIPLPSTSKSGRIIDAKSHQ